MAVSLSSFAADAALAALKTQFDGGTIRIFSGTRPATPSAAETGTLLGVVTLRGEPGVGLEYQVVEANLAKPMTPWVFTALADGDAEWFRVVGADDDHLLNYNVPRLDGDIDVVSPADMVWSSVTVAKGMHYTIDEFVYLLF